MASNDDGKLISFNSIFWFSWTFLFQFQPILNGRDSVQKVLDTFRERGGHLGEIATQYYGLLIENFECERSIYTAVEVTAGNK